MVEFNHFQPKFRSRFKKLISSRRSHTMENQPTHITQKTLAELSQKTISQQNNKKIHNMSKQSFITNKKQFLLSRKLFYKPKTQDTKLLQMENMIKFNKVNVYQNLMDQTIQQEDIFNIQKQILKNPLNFHRNMIIKVKDDEKTKGILRQWYKANVSPNKQKVRSYSQINKVSSTTSSKNSQVQLEKDKFPSSSIFNRKKIALFTNQRLKNCKSNVNESVLKKNLSFQQQKLQKQKNNQKLAKLIVRVQPFWDKVRIKI